MVQAIIVILEYKTKSFLVFLRHSRRIDRHKIDFKSSDRYYIRYICKNCITLDIAGNIRRLCGNWYENITVGFDIFEMLRNIWIYIQNCTEINTLIKSWIMIN